MFSRRLTTDTQTETETNNNNNNNKRRLTRATQLRYLRDCDVKHLDAFLNSGVDLYSPPSQPLPLPDFPALLLGAHKLAKERRRAKLKPVNSDGFRLPSPTTYKQPPGIHACREELHDGRRSVGSQQKVDSPHSIDSHRSSADTHRSILRADTWSHRFVQQSMTSPDQPQKNLRVDINSRSAPPSTNSSPMISPQRIFNWDLFSSYQEDPNRWSEAATPSGFLNTMRTENNVVSRSHYNSALHIRPVKGIKPPQKSTSGPSSPRHPKLNVDISNHNDINSTMNVHRLPLPPTPVSSKNSPVVNQWIKGKLIGRGTFGSVYAATNRETGALCAMKEVLCSDDLKSTECARQLEQEIKVLSHLKHPNIVQYYGSEIVDDKFYIYLEYVYPGSINKYVHEHCGDITEAVVRNFTRHICSGLAYLHGRKTIHRDIKGANLLVDSSGVVKLADFGTAKLLTGQAADLSMKGSPHWMAPELVQPPKDNRPDLAFAVDIWSLGCTIIEMLTGKPPWSEFEGAAAMFKVLRESPHIPETLSPEGKDFLNCCFRREPADRPPAIKLLEHSFLKNCQQLDVPSSSFSPALNFTNQMDKSNSPREIYHNKFDKVPMSPDRWLKNGKGGCR